MPIPNLATGVVALGLIVFLLLHVSQGLYLFNDLYGDLYVGDISPAIGQTGPKAVVTGMCAATSPQACDASRPFGKMLWSWGKDLNNDAYLLSSAGVFRLLPSSSCNITC